MEIGFSAPVAGVVTEVRVRQGPAGRGRRRAARDRSARAKQRRRARAASGCACRTRTTRSRRCSARRRRRRSARPTCWPPERAPAELRAAAMYAVSAEIAPHDARLGRVPAALREDPRAARGAAAGGPVARSSGASWPRSRDGLVDLRRRRAAVLARAPASRRAARSGPRTTRACACTCGACAAAARASRGLPRHAARPRCATTTSSTLDYSEDARARGAAHVRRAARPRRTGGAW